MRILFQNRFPNFAAHSKKLIRYTYKHTSVCKFWPSSGWVRSVFQHLSTTKPACVIFKYVLYTCTSTKAHNCSHFNRLNEVEHNFVTGIFSLFIFIGFVSQVAAFYILVLKTVTFAIYIYVYLFTHSFIYLLTQTLTD